MNGKKLIAAVLCVSVLAGTAGCENSFKKKKQAREAIGTIMEDYVDAVDDCDADAIIELTDWDDDDRESEALRKCFEYGGVDELETDYYELFASTVEIDYDLKDLEFDGDKAVLNVEYSIIDWEEVFDDLTRFGPSMDIREVSEDEYGTNTIKGKITFELDGKEWIITKISKIEEVYSFIGKGPFHNGGDRIFTDPGSSTDPDPVPAYTDPVPTDLDYNAIYTESCRAYVEFLKLHEKEITFAEERYNRDFVNLYDLDADGILDLFFVSADDINNDYTSASLHVYTYDVERKCVVEKITIPEICYQAEGGSFFIYVTQGAVVINHIDGEEALQHVYSEVYSCYNENPPINGLEFMGRFRRDVYYEYDPENDTETFTYEYYFSPDGNGYNNCEPATYQDSCGYLVDNAIVVVGYDYLPVEGMFEYPVTKLPDLGFISFDDAIKTYKDI